MQTVLYGKIKERRERDGGWMVNWNKHTKETLTFNCSNTTQDKTKAHKAPIDEG